MFGSIRCEARDGAGLIVVLEEDGGPTIRRRTYQILGAGNSPFELRKSPVARRCLELVRTLTDIDDILRMLADTCTGPVCVRIDLQIGRPCSTASPLPIHTPVRASCQAY